MVTKCKLKEPAKNAIPSLKLKHKCIKKLQIKLNQEDFYSKSKIALNGEWISLLNINILEIEAKYKSQFAIKHKEALKELYEKK